MFKTIIWATDGSEAADRALPTALELTAEANGRLLVVHANERLGGRGGGAPVIADEEHLQGELETKVERSRRVGRERELPRRERARHRSRRSHRGRSPKESDADVIVVGTRGHGRVAGMLLGSVTQRLLHVAGCPVLAVPVRVGALWLRVRPVKERG